MFSPYRWLGRRASPVGALLTAVVMTGAVSSTVAAAQSPPSPEVPNNAKVVAEEQVGPRLVDLTIQSPALSGKGKVRLLTPDGWEERASGDDWPVLYLLAGGDGDHLTFTDEYGLQDDPTLRNTLVVMPQMPFYGFYTDWWGGRKDGYPQVETFHLDEVRPILEDGYGAGEQRAIAGESQGGYGAIKYAAHRPGMFQAVASYSGFLHPLMYPEAISGPAEFLDIEWQQIWGDPVRQRHIWQANDPYYLADKLQDTPVYISAGDGTKGPLDPPDVEPDPTIPGLDELAELYPEEVISVTESIMGDESRAVAYRFKQAGVPVTTHFTRGTHSPVYWQDELDRSLPMLLGALPGS